jgi:lipopolysaccharide transport system ATP-binding protein
LSDSAVSFDSVSKKFTLSPNRPRTLQEGFVGMFGALDRTSDESFWALRDISLAVPRGQMTGLIGTNGSGKSTLLKLISRIIFPTSGAVAVNGRVGALLELGAGFHSDLTGRENVFLSGSLLGMSRKEIAKRYDAIVSFSGLEDFIYVPVKHYSSGMFMRLGFSTVIHLDPDILLVDEILAVGDQAFQQKCLAKIADLKRQQKTIIFVSHDLGTIRDLCDQVVWIDDGRVRAEGPAREITSRYLLELWQREGDNAGKGESQSSGEGARATDRWGNRMIEITRARLLDGEGNPFAYLSPGDPLRVQIEYQVNQPVDDVAFGILIYDPDGVCYYGTTTVTDEVDLPALGDKGEISVHFPQLPLLSGEYLMDVAVHTRADQPYDYHRGSLRFVVRSIHQETGFFRPEHKWFFNERELKWIRLTR